VTATGVTAELGGNTILRGIDITVCAGEIVALVGPNGAGKSTLFGVLAGDIPPARGSVDVDGRPLTEWSAVELAQRRAVMPQQAAVTFPFRVRDVVRMGRAPWAGTSAEDDDEAIVDAAIAAADMGDFAARRFISLSGGEKARVAFARTLAQQSQLLLLDEPTASLDVRHQELLLGVVRERARSGAGVIVVLHDLSLAAAYADRIAVMARGEIVANGPPSQVCTASLLSEVYECEMAVIAHPETGELLITPVRGTFHRAS
jgi:iron complex transport system ATP-binding protein